MFAFSVFEVAEIALLLYAGAVVLRVGRYGGGGVVACGRVGGYA